MNRGAIVLLLIILLSLFAGMAGTGYGAIPQKEREALIALYNSTNGDNWIIKSGWKTSTPHTDGFALPGTENKWYGITCDEGNTMVLRIDLNNNHLAGPIPPELANLTNLQHLYITRNQLSGSIPTTLSELTNLISLDLHSNQLSDKIPPDLTKLVNLTTLNLSSNELTDKIPPGLDQLSQLVWLDLASNQLEDTIPQELYKLTNLQWLRLESNKLTGNIPTPESSQLQQLQKLFLAFNQLTGPIPPELGNLSNLKWLHLASNNLTGPIPPDLGRLSKLEFLGLGSNQLSGEIPSELGNLSTNLSKLSLFSNELSGDIPPALGNLSALNELNLDFNKLTGNTPPELGNLSNLKWLYLASNQLTGSIPQAMEKLVNLNVGGSDFRWNGLYTGNESLRNLLNNAQKDNDWESTQTIAPEQVTALALSATSIEVSWIPIIYSGDKGGYSVFYSSTPGGPYTLFGDTEAKSDGRLEALGLNPATKYYFVVQTRTEPHEHNQNIVNSEYSAESSAETANEYLRIISGVVATEKGKGIEGVTLVFLPSNQCEVTNISGNYSHAVETGWSGTVTPLKTGYTFEPEKKIFENVISDQPGTNFKVRLFPLSISGKVTSGDEGIEGVTLNFTAGGAETEIGITNADGYYSHEVPYVWTGRATPAKGDLLFYPPFIDYPLPGITGNRDHQDYQLSVSLALTAARKQDSTLIIRKEYGEIELKAILIGISTSTVKTFSIYRKEANGAYQPNNEFPASSQTDSYQFTYRDEYLEKGKTYTYIARAIDAQGKIIGESQEKTI